MRVSQRTTRIPRARGTTSMPSRRTCPSRRSPLRPRRRRRRLRRDPRRNSSTRKTLHTLRAKARGVHNVPLCACREICCARAVCGLVWHMKAFRFHPALPAGLHPLTGSSVLPLSLPLSTAAAECIPKGGTLPAPSSGAAALLHSAVSTGSVESVSRIISVYGLGAINLKSKAGDTPLQVALRLGYVDVVNFLLGAGASRDA